MINGAEINGEEMSEAAKQTVALGVLWAVIAGCVLMGAWALEKQDSIINQQDKVHTRELDEVRRGVNQLRVEWRQDIRDIDAKIDTIISRLPTNTN